MQLIITSPLLENFLSLEVFPDFPLSSLKAMIAEEVPTIPENEILLYLAGHLVNDNDKAIQDQGIKDQDMLVLHTRRSLREMGLSRRRGEGSQGQQLQQQQQQQGGGAGGSSQQGEGAMNDPEMVRLRVLGNPELMSRIRESEPELADAVNDPQRFGEIFQIIEKRRQEEDMERRREMAQLEADPFNVEAQKKIEELIQQEQIRENLQTALEYNPEIFGRVTMLYIPVEVNSHPIKAFVDSGAQTTIMSPSCAEQCGIMRLVDKRFAGTAVGVGTAQILGRVHSAVIKIGTLFLSCSFTVMEGKDVDLLLGLDMLKRHQACIDLIKNSLVIGDVEVPFLPESEIPKSFAERHMEQMAEGESGALVGGETGTVLRPPANATQPAPGAGHFSGQGHMLGGGGGGGGNTGTPVPADIPSAQTPRPDTILSPTTIPPPGTGTHAPPLPQGRQTSFPDELIQQLTNLGFTRSEAEQALRSTNGNVELAASILFGS